MFGPHYLRGRTDYSSQGTWAGQIFLKESLEKRRVLSEVFSSLASVTFFWSESVTT